MEVQPDDNAETVALRAVERHEADVAVVDRQQHLLGAIPIGRLLALLHEEHVDNFLRMGGIGAVHAEPTAEPSTVAAFRARMPWLTIGLIGGLLAGGVAAFFELALKQEIALAFFLPLVEYMAHSVGRKRKRKPFWFGRWPMATWQSAHNCCAMGLWDHSSEERPDCWLDWLCGYGMDDLVWR